MNQANNAPGNQITLLKQLQALNNDNIALRATTLTEDSATCCLR